MNTKKEHQKIIYNRFLISHYKKIIILNIILIHRFPIVLYLLKAVNKDEVKVTLKEDLPEDTDLQGATITLTDAEGNTIEATIKEDTNAERTEFTFVLPEGKELVDAEKYTVTSELFADSTLDAQFGPQVIKEIIANTTKIAEGNLKVELDTKNQYGEDEVSEGATLRIKEGTAKLNEMPLTADEIQVKDNTVTFISKAEGNQSSVTFKKGDKVEFVVEATYKAEAEDENTEPEVTATSKVLEYEIQAAETPTPDKIAALTATAQVGDAEDAESVTVKQNDKVEPKSTVTLTADVRDQFNNKVTDADIRWVVTEGIELLGEETQKITVNKTQQLEVKALLPGKVTVEAYNIANGEKQTFSFEIDKTHIEKLNWDAVEPLNVVNKEETTLGTLTVNEGADFSAEQVEFKVEALDENNEVLTDEEGNPVVVSEDDVKVVAVDEKVQGDDGEVAEDAETEVVVKVTTNKPGKYQITPIVKGTDVEANSKIVTSKVDSEITRFEVDLEGMKEEYKFDTGFSAPITFFNKNNEVVTGAGVDEVKLTSTNDKFEVKVEAITDEEGNATENEQLVVSLKEDAKQEATETTTIVVEVPGSPSESFQVKFVEAQIKGIKVEGEPITVQGGKETVELRPLTILDQHGDAMKSVEAGELEAVLAKDAELTGFETEVVPYVKDEETGELSIAKEGQEATGLALKVDANNVKIDKKTTVDVIVQTVVKDDSEEKPEKTSVQVTVNENSVLKDFTIEAATTATTQGGNIEVFVKPVDQYGEVYEIEAEEIQVTAGEDEELIFKPIKQEAKNDDEGKLLGYTVTLTGATEGTQELTFTIGEDEDAQSKSETFTVGNAGQLIDKVAIEVEEEEYITADEEQAVALKAKVTDKEGKEVSVDAKELTWTIKSVKDAEGNELKLDDNGNVLDAEGNSIEKSVTINDEGELVVSQGLTVDVEVQVESSNLKKATATYTFKGDERAYKEGFSIFGSDLGTVALAPEEEGYSNVYDITFDGEKDVATAITLTFGGIDQYGDTFILEEGLSVTVPGTKGIVEGETFEKGQVEVDEKQVDASQLTLTVKKAGTTEYLVKYGEEVIKLNITVSEEAEEAKVAEDKAKADRDDVEKAKELVKTDEAYKVSFETKDLAEEVKNDIEKALKEKNIEGVDVTVKEIETDALEPTHEVTLTKGEASEKVKITIEREAEKLPEVEFTDGQFKNGTDEVEKQDATAATFTATISVGDGEDAKSAAGTIKVKVGESEEVEVTVTENQSAADVAQAIVTAFANNDKYTVAAEDATITFTATDTNKGAKAEGSTVTIEDKSEETNVKISGEVTFANGTDEVKQQDATAATYSFTVSEAKHPGTIKVTVGEETVEVEIAEGKLTAQDVAQAIVTAFAENTNYDVKAEDAQVTFTAKTPGSTNEFTVTTKDQTSEDKKAETPGA